MITKEDILKLSTEQQVHYWLGRVCLSIGTGSTWSTIYEIMDFYTRVGYERAEADAAARNDRAG